MDLSFQEKSHWASLFAIVGVFGYHFHNVFGAVEAITTVELMVRLIGVIIVIVVIEIVLHIVIAVTAIKDAEDGGALDERDVLVNTRAFRNAYVVLFIGVLHMIGYVIAGDLSSEPRWEVTPANTANLLLFVLVIAEIVNYASRLYYYRRGV
jgi:hypothetical protein